MRARRNKRSSSGRDAPRRLLAAPLLAAIFLLPGALTAQTCYRGPSGRIVTRPLPGFVVVPCPPKPAGAPPPAAPEAASPSVLQGSVENEAPGEVAPPAKVSPLPRPQPGDYAASVPLPDRWRIVDMLGYKSNLLDPYNRNVLKADRPVFGSWFFNLGLIAESVFESRDLPTGVGVTSTRSAGENDVFGRSRRVAFAQNVATELTWYKGDTVFLPPPLQFKVTPVFNYNHASLNEVQGVNIDPRRGTTRSDHFIGLQEAFAEARLRVVSERFDFDSVRLGIQPFSSDFRGFLFQDNQPGVRLFGTRYNNRVQYNLGWFRILRKDTNSGLNDVGRAPRHDDLFVANVYRQDTPTPGFTSQLTVLYNRDREAGEVQYDRNGFIVIPAALGLERARDFDVVYLGYNGDGHFGRLNLTASLYYAGGQDRHGTFVDRNVRVSAGFAAAEMSVDFSWVRPRLSLLYATGDKNAYDGKETGFDAVFENPQFAGADTSFWIGQAVPLIGGGGVTLSGPNAILNNLRSSKDEGQSNFANPGLALAGVGADADVLPTLRVSLNVNDLYFAATQVLEAARDQGGIDKHIGEDISAAFIWRPLDSQNIVLRASYAHLIPGAGYRNLFPGRSLNYVLLNALFTY